MLVALFMAFAIPAITHADNKPTSNNNTQTSSDNNNNNTSSNNHNTGNPK